ncbi:WD repeat protein [Metarhizium rileyi]|uniref:WD repeat protein n=1 Tax=Metarhizium rileyi (strain RCEF 4871) TaxID=1649241 RepID=A0A167FAU7_METRR|nr:WD repeat protein [Metarhizium rileyi RCEF 4871]
MDLNNADGNSDPPGPSQRHPEPDDGSAGDSASWYYDLDDIAEDEDIDDDEDSDYRDEPDEDDGEDDDFQDALPGDVEFELLVGEYDDEEAEENEEGDRDHDDNDDDDDNDVDDDEENDPVRHIMALFRGGGRSGLLTRTQLMALLRNRDLSNALFSDNADDEGFLSHWGIRRRRQPKDPNRFPKVPSMEGLGLMRAGAFGVNDYDLRMRKHIARRILERELGVGDGDERRRNSDLVTQAMIPGTRAEQIIHYDDPVYSGQFSDDGNFFYSCCQDFKVRMYDTSNPYNWKHYKTVSYPWGRWTLTDASLSPDNRWLAYTSIQSMVSIAPTDPNDTGNPYTLELDDGGRSTQRGWGRRGEFGIWSIRFSGDGRELVAGTSSSSLVVYDIESRQVLHHIDGHDDHVNAVCFADKSSPHILYSGSDDATIKVWDRRSMGDGREAGAFVGHIEGLTYIDSKGDGRYILSNGKDQSMKLWDLRMVMSTDRFRDTNPSQYSNSSGFDYRGEAYDDEDWDVHPHDNSVVTFRGHRVLRTLIRCHFSPPSATNSRYVYSGSSDGKVYIWNMDATLAGKIDVKKATMGTRRVDHHTRLHFEEPTGWGTCVRDASWHPNAPMIVASAWNGYSMARGTCTLHAFNESSDDEGEPDMRRSVNAMLRPDPDVYQMSNY